MSDTTDDEGDLALFNEPEGWAPPEKPCTYQTFTIQEHNEHGDVFRKEIKLRLVGSSPLWGHLLWQAGRVLATHLTTHRERLVQNRSVLELGAGAGLPSLVCALSGGASTVVCTDYPDPELVENLKINVDEVKRLMSDEKSKRECKIIADGYLWGADVTALIKHLKNSASDGAGENKFDLLILGDLLFNHSEHNKLLLSVRRTLARRADARVLVFFTPYRPWLFEKDMAFFDLARRVGSSQKSDNRDEVEEKQQEEEMKMAEDGYGPFVVEKVLEHVMEEVMFKEDRGDEMLRRTVFGYELSWQDLQSGFSRS